MQTRFWTWWPLAVLASLASYISAPALAATYLAGLPTGTAFVAASAVHAAWIVSCIQRRHLLLRIAAWVVCLSLAQDGLTRLTSLQSGLLTPLAVETVLLLAAMSAASPLSLADRLAGWRRAREAAMAQLVMADGVLSWIPAFFRRLFAGRAEPASAGSRLDRAQLLAELEDAEALAVLRHGSPQ